MAWSSPRCARQNGGDGMMAQRKRNAALYVRVSTDGQTVERHRSASHRLIGPAITNLGVSSSRTNASAMVAQLSAVAVGDIRRPFCYGSSQSVRPKQHRYAKR